jgi:hypothetical protein
MVWFVAQQCDPSFQPTVKIWINNSGGKGLPMVPYAHPLHMKWCEQGKTPCSLATAPWQMHSEWATTKVMNCVSFKRWVNLKNGQEFVYDSRRYLKPRDEGPLKRIAMKKRKNDKWRAKTTGMTADPSTSPEKEEAETMAVDALMALHGQRMATVSHQVQEVAVMVGKRIET